MSTGAQKSQCLTPTRTHSARKHGEGFETAASLLEEGDGKNTAEEDERKADDKDFYNLRESLILNLGCGLENTEDQSGSGSNGHDGACNDEAGSQSRIDFVSDG